MSGESPSKSNQTGNAAQRSRQVQDTTLQPVPDKLGHAFWLMASMPADFMQDGRKGDTHE